MVVTHGKNALFLLEFLWDGENPTQASFGSIGTLVGLDDPRNLDLMKRHFVRKNATGTLKFFFRPKKLFGVYCNYICLFTATFLMKNGHKSRGHGLIVEQESIPVFSAMFQTST